MSAYVRSFMSYPLNPSPPPLLLSLYCIGTCVGDGSAYLSAQQYYPSDLYGNMYALGGMFIVYMTLAYLTLRTLRKD